MNTEWQSHLLYLDEVYVSYSDSQDNHKVILNNINMKVFPGEFITIVGPSGCGKSTLLRLILGAEKPTRGTVVINGEPVEGPSRNRGIVFQRYSLFPHLTVLENITLGLGLEAFSLLGRYIRPSYRRKRKEFNQKGLQYLERIGLADAADNYPYQLSGGMKQRVAIAQALIMNPKILLMDEPFGALDHATRQEMQLFIQQQWKQMKTTIFFVTHDREEALFLGTRIWVLSHYYQDAHGAKIVVDKDIPGPHPKPDSTKYTTEFTQMLEQIRRDGLDPEYLQRIDEFDLSHRDAYSQLPKNE